MDVDPTPNLQPVSPTPPEPATAAFTSSPAPVAAVNPVIANALAGELNEDKEPQPAINPAPEKKSHKGLIVTIIIILILIAAGLVWYVFYSPFMAKTPTADTSTKTEQTAITPATSSSTDTIIDEASDAMTTNSSDEATTVETDDSASATEASTSAGNVGGSVDESTF